MDSSDPNNYKPCVFKFLPGNEVLKAKDLTDLSKSKNITTYNWKIKGISGLEILDQADNQIKYKGDKGSFGHSYYTMVDKTGKKDVNLHLYLIET
jgi:predicted secreted protein